MLSGALNSLLCQIGAQQNDRAFENIDLQKKRVPCHKLTDDSLAVKDLFDKNFL